MYNESVKKRYVIEKESTTYTPNDYLTRLFRKTEEHENNLEKDISSFTFYEIMDFYKTLNLSSVESIAVMNSHLGLYTDWCLKQNMVPDCQNHFTELSTDAFLQCVNRMALRKSIVPKETIYRWIDELINPSEAFIMIALFEGIKGKDFCEITYLKMSDFDGNKVKLCTGREIEVSDKLVEIAKIADVTMEHYSVNKENSRVYTYLDEEYIMKSLCNSNPNPDDFARGRRVYRTLMRNFEYLGVKDWMKASYIEESGKIEYIKTRSKELGITPKEFLFSDYVEEVDYKYESDLRRLRSSYFKKYEEYLV